MDCGPLNLAHFHERRAEKFLFKHRYDDAIKAIEMSILYLKEAYKNVRLPKSMEVLNTLKWDLERKLQQMQIRKNQRSKLKEIVPINDSASVLTLRSESNNIPIQSAAKSIDETIQDFHAKSIICSEECLQSNTKENKDPKFLIQPNSVEKINFKGHSSEQSLGADNARKEASAQSSFNASGDHRSENDECENITSQCEELPVLAPLELPPTFDFPAFDEADATRSSLADMAALAGNFQK